MARLGFGEKTFYLMFKGNCCPFLDIHSLHADDWLAIKFVQVADRFRGLLCLAKQEVV